MLWWECWCELFYMGWNGSRCLNTISSESGPKLKVELVKCMDNGVNMLEYWEGNNRELKMSICSLFTFVNLVFMVKSFKRVHEMYLGFFWWLDVVPGCVFAGVSVAWSVIHADVSIHWCFSIYWDGWVHYSVVLVHCL